MTDGLKWLRTVRHFPPSALWHRLRLKIARKRYRAPSFPDGWIANLAEEWHHVCPPQAVSSLSLIDFNHWQLDNPPNAGKARQQTQAKAAAMEGQGTILNAPFSLPRNAAELKATLALQTPLWRENYGYLEFLLPLVFALQASGTYRADTDKTLIEHIESQCRLFWALDRQTRNWSTYGVSRRLLTYGALLPVLEAFSAEFQAFFWRQFLLDSHWVARFPELDIRGNHLVKNLKAWLLATLVLDRLPTAKNTADTWWAQLSAILPAVFGEQVLPDGFHYERTPMYHAWVLTDLLDCLSWLKQAKPEQDWSALKALAGRMLTAMATMRHSSGQLPMFGDSSQPQTPDVDALLAYGDWVLHDAPTDGNAPCGYLVATNPEAKQDSLTHFLDAGFAVMRLSEPAASLVLDCGDFGPRFLPAHSHCDLGSFEVHIEEQPVIVDAGITEYDASLVRDYFRGTAAHNTLWVPEEEQAEIWSGFRVAEYPHVEGCTVEQDASGGKVTLAYENYRHRYRHQRSVYSVDGRFWVVQDWLTHITPTNRPRFSLLHIHPDCAIRYDQEIFSVGNHLLVVPFGASKIEWSSQSPWRNNLNLYSPGFSLAQPGQLIAITPKPTDCFGWVLVPYGQTPPVCEKLGEGLEIRFTEGAAYQVTWESAGLRVAVRAPAP